MISPKNARVSCELLPGEEYRAHAPAHPTSSKLLRSLMLSVRVLPLQYIPNFMAIPSIFALKPGSETRRLVHAPTWLIAASVIWAAEVVAGTSLTSAALEASRTLGGTSACGGMHGLTRGDMGALLTSSLPFNSLRAEALEPVKSRQRRYLAFPEGSTLTLKTGLDIPVGSLYEDNKLLDKYIEYAFVIQLPSEKVIFTGLKDVFKFPKEKKQGYGAPRPGTVIYGSSTPENYGPPGPPQGGYGPPQAPSVSYASSEPSPPTYGSPGSPPATYGSPESPPATYSSPESPPATYGSSGSPTGNYGPPQAHSELSLGAAAPASGGEPGGGSSYSNLRKDLEGNANGENTYHLGVLEQHNFQYSNHNFTLGEEAYEGEHSEWQESLENLPPDAVDVIMSPLDHQRLLGFLAIEKTFDSAGLPGRWCVLKAVCEVAAEPLTEFGLLGEMVNLFLAAGYGDGSPALVEYMIAEEIGYMDGTCDRHFHACKVDLVGLLSTGAAALGGGLASAAG